MDNWAKPIVEVHTGQTVDISRVRSPEGKWGTVGPLDGTFRLWVPEVETEGAVELCSKGRLGRPEVMSEGTQRSCRDRAKGSCVKLWSGRGQPVKL